jgi:hypothetical protein
MATIRGVVSTGAVGIIRNSVAVIHQRDAAPATKMVELANAILASRELNDAQKGEATDLVKDIAEDFATPPQERRSATVMKALPGSEPPARTSADLYTLGAHLRLTCTSRIVGSCRTA